MKQLLNILLLFICCAPLNAQYNSYTYSRRIDDVASIWNKITPMSPIYGKVQTDFTDIRVVNIQGSDTIEAPFIVRQLKEQALEKEIRFKTINEAKNSTAYYFTFELDSPILINSITPIFAQQNFDWRLNLEGSTDLKEWFSIKENYRVLSVKNSETDYSFTKIVFPESKYRYYRIAIKSNEKPQLTKAFIKSYISTKGLRHTQTIKNIAAKKDLNYSVVEVSLPYSILASEFKTFVNYKFDYYRPVTIEYFIDSIKTQKGVIHNYAHLATGVISSVDESALTFPEQLVSKLRLKIYNGNDTPLNIDSIHLSGFSHELIFRTEKQGIHYLLYGNRNAAAPVYDLAMFANKIPDSISTVNIGAEVVQPKVDVSIAPLFENKLWLWVIMVVIIILLGGATFKMLKGVK